MIEKTGNDLVVIASDPQELAEGQAATIVRMKEKEAAAEIEVRQARVTLEAAARAKINTGPVKRILAKAEHRLMFLGKARQALEAGYVIVPNFPGDTIAIRVKRSGPRSKDSISTYGKRSAIQSLRNERPEILPVDEGRYVSPRQIVSTSVVKEVDPRDATKTRDKHVATAISLNSELGIPAEFLRPTVLQRTGKCFERRIFDEVAVSDNRFMSGRGRGDPMVIGRIFDASTRFKGSGLRG